jgi:hypothetical protein
VAKKGEKQPEHVKRKIAESLRGRKRPASVVKKMSESLKGNIPWNKGKKGVYSKSTLKKISEGGKGRIPWNKGLTKETNKSLKAASDKLTGRKGLAPNKRQLKALEKGRRWCKGLTKETSKSVKVRSKKVSLALKGRENPEHSKFLKDYYKKNPDKHPNYILAQKAKSDPRVKTYIENLFGQGLEEQGIKAQYNFKVGRWWVDYAVPSLKIAFECDGEY